MPNPFDLVDFRTAIYEYVADDFSRNNVSMRTVYGPISGLDVSTHLTDRVVKAERCRRRYIYAFNQTASGKNIKRAFPIDMSKTGTSKFGQDVEVLIDGVQFIYGNVSAERIPPTGL